MSDRKRTRAQTKASSAAMAAADAKAKRLKLSHDSSLRLVKEINSQINSGTSNSGTSDFQAITELETLRVAQGWCLLLVYRAWAMLGQDTANSIVVESWNDNLITDPTQQEWWQYLDGANVDKQIEMVKALANNMVEYIDERFVKLLMNE